MADLGIKLTDDRMRALSRRLEGVYSEGYKTAIANNEKAIAKLASLTDEKLEGLSDEAKVAKRQAFANQVLRTEKLRDQIAADIANAGETAAKIIQGEMNGIYSLNYDFSSYSISRQVGLNLSADFTIYDRNQLAVLVQEGQSPFTKIAYNNLGKDKRIVQRLQNQLIQGVMNGESQQKLIRRIKAVTGQSTSQARRVAQTERTRVQSQGRNMGILEAERIGVKMDKQWIARMVRTRDSHAEINGEIVASDEIFGNGLQFPGDPVGSAEDVINCHCLIKPMVRSVSPALKAHREKFGTVSFEQYQKQRGGA